MDAEPMGDDGLQGLRVFIAEDESLIMMLLEDILADFGCEMAAGAQNIRTAVDGATSVDADIAILDINLGGDPVFPAAERLVARGIPVIFASGYGAAALPEEWKDRPTLPKPFSAAQVGAALASVMAGKVP